MLNGQEIDKAELAKVAKAARERDGLTQAEVAQEIGVVQNWVSQIEMGKASFAAPENCRRVKDLAKVLKFNVPYLGAQSAPEPVKTVVAVPLPPVRQPSNPPAAHFPPLQVRATPAPDVELEAIRACSEIMEKLKDKEVCQRVLGYLRNRYGLPRLPDVRS